jgi:hypothetical protein
VITATESITKRSPFCHQWPCYWGRLLSTNAPPIACPVMTKICEKSDLLVILSVAVITFLSPFYVTKKCHKNVTFLSPILVNLKNKTYVFFLSPFCHKIVTVFSERFIFISKSASFFYQLIF